VAKIAALLFILVYAVIYWAEPFSAIWNVILTNLFLVIASSLTAFIATLIWALYDQADIPRRVWSNFAIGLWLWAVAELTWGYLNVTQGEVPEGISDIFWIIAYLFFGQALVFQYQLLARPTKQGLVGRILVALLIFLAVYQFIFRTLISDTEAPGSFGAVINSFYPAADLLLALVALWLASHFMGGAFSRPWLGLLAFAFADFLYAWAEISGVYSWGINRANLLSTITDVAYLGAYLVLGLGILSQWVFLKYGLRSPSEAH
jgi:hypothetical protein